LKTGEGHLSLLNSSTIGSKGYVYCFTALSGLVGFTGSFGF